MTALDGRGSKPINHFCHSSILSGHGTKQAVDGSRQIQLTDSGVVMDGGNKGQVGPDILHLSNLSGYGFNPTPAGRCILSKKVSAGVYGYVNLPQCHPFLKVIRWDIPALPTYRPARKERGPVVQWCYQNQ